MKKFRIIKIIFAENVKKAIEMDNMAEIVDVCLDDDVEANKMVGFAMPEVNKKK